MTITERIVEVKFRAVTYRLWIDITDLMDYQLEAISTNLINDRIGKVAKLLDDTIQVSKGSEMEQFKCLREVLSGKVNAFQMSSDFDRNGRIGFVHYYDWP